MGREFVEFTEFKSDEAKRHINIQKHGIDFADASKALGTPHVGFVSVRNGEVRTLAICPGQKKLITIVYTMRGESCRIISARTASEHEQRAYRQIYG